MACILKLKTNKTPGIVSFTTQERDKAFRRSRELRSKLETLRQTHLVGLHHNWHDWSYEDDGLFDFHFSGEGDLKGTQLPKYILNMDACNFVQKSFYPIPEGQKFWDILYVARAVYFKRIPEFFRIIKKLYSQNKYYRVLLICPIPPFSPKEKKTVYYEIREDFEQMFSPKERQLFNLITLNYDYPFPLDLETLSVFFRQSRTFVHTSNDERRCRVAGYAWAAGLPVVGMDAIGSLLPLNLRSTPWYYEPKSYDDFPELIVKAVDNSDLSPEKQKPIHEFFNSQFSGRRLLENLKEISLQRGFNFDSEGFLLEKLDLRLGRHHEVSIGPNNLKPSLNEFLDLLENPERIPEEKQKQEDLELSISESNFQQKKKRKRSWLEFTGGFKKI